MGCLSLCTRYRDIAEAKAKARAALEANGTVLDPAALAAAWRLERSRTLSSGVRLDLGW